MQLMDKGQVTIMTDKSKDFCHAQLKMRDNEFCDATLASVDGQKFKAHKVILSASCNFVTLINTEKAKLEETRWIPL